MLEWLNPLREMTSLSIAVRMVLAVAIGAAIGLERSARNRPAGFRTHILVCLGACVAALSGLYLYLVLRLPTDISRLSAQVISGLGFIGAGTIIVTKKMTIKGLTTAAGLWTTGIIGLAIGSGYYELGVAGAALVLLAETVFGALGSHIRHEPEYSVEILYNEKTSLDNVLRYCKDNRMTIANLTIHTRSGETHESAYVAEVKLRGAVSAEELTSRIRQMQGVVEAIIA